MLLRRIPHQHVAAGTDLTWRRDVRATTGSPDGHSHRQRGGHPCAAGELMAEQLTQQALFTQSEVKAIFGISSPTLWRWRKRGFIKAITISPGIIRIRREEVERLAGGPV